MSTLESKLSALHNKYALTGQSIDSYLEGLLLSNYVGYWDYIHLDTLLSLQSPKTDFPDEKIFIVYHQITELYFNLCLHEIEQIANNGLIVASDGKVEGWNQHLDPDFFKSRLKRIINYFNCLIDSFSIMINGMDKEQFLRYRMALLPASGFQSAQYRKIELASTDPINLVHSDHRERLNNEDSPAKILEFIYWKQGAIDVSTQKKTYTLEQFEKKYQAHLTEWISTYNTKNIFKKYQELLALDKGDQEMVLLLKEYDKKVNIDWPMVHLKSASRYLENKEETTQATGGTNWKKYLPPRFQRRIFFPHLYTSKEIEDWGK